MIAPNAVLIKRRPLRVIVPHIEIREACVDWRGDHRFGPFLRGRIEQSGGDDIARERIAKKTTVVCRIDASREGIEDLATRAAEVAAQLLRCRDVGESGSWIDLPVALVRKEEESLLFPDGDRPMWRQTDSAVAKVFGR